MMNSRLWVIVSGALVFAGCGDNEAKRFGYVGRDLAETDPMYFSTGPTVTNWVPARVLSVSERYELSEGESKLLAAAGVISPGEELTALPEGYAEQDVEPWFTTWTRPYTAFGLDGITGFLSHYDEERKVWSTSESYFSSYWKSAEEAEVALARVKEAIREGYGVKKFYDFERCWVAEYVRLRVMCVVGQKADGRWTCMLDIQDKNRPGCGMWEPVEEQREMRARVEAVRAHRQWRAAVPKYLAENHAAVEKSLAQAGLKGFVGVPDWQANEGDANHPPFQMRAWSAAYTNDFEDVWTAKLAEVKAAVGLVPMGAPMEQKTEDGGRLRFAVMRDARYELRLDVVEAPLPPRDEAAPEPTAQPCPRGGWRIIYAELPQDGITVPVRPQGTK